MSNLDRRKFLKLAGSAAAIPSAAAPTEVLAEQKEDENSFDLTPFTYAEAGTPKDRVVLQRELIEHIRTLEKSGKI